MAGQERSGFSDSWKAPGIRKPRAFWTGTILVTVGVILHLPMLLGAKSMGYMLTGMPWDIWMEIGMPLIIIGLGIIYYALVPLAKLLPASEQQVIRAAEDTRLTRAHIELILVLLVAIAINTVKPFTFTFILPGVAHEYGLSTPAHHVAGALPVGLFPLAGITGTAVGSFVWGILGDRIGRRTSILLSCVIFIATSMCGAMAPFGVNLVLCFVMGLSVGGLLPIAYALLTETIPARYRGQVIVLVAGTGTAAGFLITSWSANWLIPIFGWRMMWFIGLPTGVLLIALQRYLPESPRFLAATGRMDEARAVMRKLGLTVVTPGLAEPEPLLASTASRTSELFRYPFRNLTLALALTGIAWGLANFGFIVWLPTTITGTGLSVASITSILAKAALFAVPGSVLLAWMYGRWSSKGTVVVSALATGAALALFAVFGAGVARNTVLLVILLIFLLMAMWGLISALSPYSAEVYPVGVRARGAGITAGSSKLGGVIALVLSVLVLVPFGVRDTALIAAVPALAGALAIWATGIETRYAHERASAPREHARQPE